MCKQTGATAMLWIVALVIGAAVVAFPAAAQPASDTLRLADAIELARRANPALQATRLRAEMAAEGVAPAGAMPDPLLSFGFMNRPLDFGADQMMTMNTVQLMQRLPWPGKLGFARQRAQHIAAAEELDAREAEVNLVARVKSMYYQLAYMDRALAIMVETRDLLRDFHQVSSAMYGVGTGLQQDVLQAQVAIASMTEDITVLGQNRVGMAARLNALLGRTATAAVSALELPVATGALPSVDSLMQLALEERPALRAARERIQGAEAGYRAAGRAIYPDLTFTLGYGQRPRYKDLATVGVGISIPLFAGARQIPLRRQMEAMQAMEEARALDLDNETYARLVELTAEAERARNLSDLYATSVLPQARAAVESALSAYRVGRVDYMTLIQNEMTVNRYEIESVRLVTQYNQAVAGMEALIGVGLGDVQ